MLKVLGYYDLCTGEGERWPTVCVSRGQILQNLNFKEVVTPPGNIFGQGYSSIGAISVFAYQMLYNCPKAFNLELNSLRITRVPLTFRQLFEFQSKVHVD